MLITNLLSEAPLLELPTMIDEALKTRDTATVRDARRVLTVVRDGLKLVGEKSGNQSELIRSLSELTRELGRFLDGEDRLMKNVSILCSIGYSESVKVTTADEAMCRFERAISVQISADPSKNFEEFHRSRRKIRRVTYGFMLWHLSGTNDSAVEAVSVRSIPLNNALGDEKDKYGPVARF
ncbi:hypothetical protein [Rathayibacter sp. AY1C7]|uniref:hypothetical protein n=1 Tax=Rathayibacter sp. AY1C7 TaxID=2080540 RepID=UPI0011B0B050|nr:hypothetical protein [Rathayibacter sp. AY1C7]